MKRFSFLALSLALAAIPAAAQYAPGMVSIGGAALYERIDREDNPFFDNDVTQFLMEPTIGLSLDNGLMIGTGVIFAVTGNGDNTTIGLRPFIRMNSAIAEKAGAYFKLAPMFSHTSEPNDFSTLTYGIGAEGGVYYFISQKFSLELSLLGANYQYASRRFDGEEDESASVFQLGYMMEGAGVSVLYHF